jgi:poly-gamma-glutamate synthase PgsB/CapB
MYSFLIILGIIIVAAAVGFIEFARHQKRIYSIPVRIHINGTRGKSSVTRLVGAGLRAGGITTITKVTGTFPRLILEDGTETYIYRKSDPNILEQLSIVKYAARKKVHALVMECMALQPQFQWITENQMVHANIGVMTNVRLDHVDVMGHTLPEIAETLGKTIPKNEHLFTAENIIHNKLQQIAGKKNTQFHRVDASDITAEEMAGFSYIEHRENVALALAICEHLGVDRNTALKGMHWAIPDEGVLKRFTIKEYGKELSFFNAFAANDPDSTLMIWRMIRDEIGFDGTKIVLLNTRQDRLDRARQLAELTAKKLGEELDYLILMGQSTEVVENLTVVYGLPRNKIINLGWVEPEQVYEQLLNITDKKSTTVAIGNMGGMGAKTAEYFEHRSF